MGCGQAKALELFLPGIPEEANKVTKDRGSKKPLSLSLSLCNFLPFGFRRFVAMIFLPTSVLFRVSSVISTFFDFSVFGLP